jgi:hypothetical protein
MKFVNGWRYLAKNRDRVEVRLRIGLVTVFDLFIDVGGARWSITLCNFTLASSKE